MEKRFPKLMSAASLALLMLSFLVATPAHGANPLAGAGEIIAPPSAVPAQSVWATLNAVPQGNYPGGNLKFLAFVVNSDKPPNGNVTLLNETLTAPALPPNFQTNTGIGLPIELSPGQAIENTIYLSIPSDFTRSNFTANLVANAALFNGTANVFIKITANTTVFLLGLPGTGTQTTASSTSQSTQTTTTQSGTVSTTVFAVGIAIPLIVVVILLILLVRRGGGRK